MGFVPNLRKAIVAGLYHGATHRLDMTKSGSETLPLAIEAI
jgi:hypothetical protein